VGTYLVDDATHHVHAHKPEEFNETIREILEIVDSSADLIPELKTTTHDSTNDTGLHKSERRRLFFPVKTRGLPMSCAATETTVPPINGERSVVFARFAASLRSFSNLHTEFIVLSFTLTRRTSWMSDWLPSWRPTSEAQLEEAEKNILSCKHSHYYIYSLFLFSPSTSLSGPQL
jgi:hypothetical protein